ncbi:MAG: thymidine kinase [Anaerolineae bacterium]|nr:thymidine kinase [Anaerolineae bacterium]
MPYHQPKGGWIELICGGMFAGKSEELLRRIRRAEIARQPVQVFKPAIDDRYGVDVIASHNGMRREALIVRGAREILECLHPETRVVAIDEAQFFDPALADVCNELADRGLRVIVAGLDLDFRGEPFGPIPLLMAQAEIVDKLHAICQVCGAPACRTQRLVNGQPASYDDPVVLIGASEVYEARCRDCHEVPAKPKRQSSKPKTR